MVAGERAGRSRSTGGSARVVLAVALSLLAAACGPGADERGFAQARRLLAAGDVDGARAGFRAIADGSHAPAELRRASRFELALLVMRQGVDPWPAAAEIAALVGGGQDLDRATSAALGHHELDFADELLDAFERIHPDSGALAGVVERRRVEIRRERAAMKVFFEAMRNCYPAGGD